MRALRPAPRVTFVSRRKSPKACRGCAPGPRCVVTALSALAPLCSGSRRAASCVFTGSLASAAAWGTHSPAALAAPLWDADSLRVPFPLSSKKNCCEPGGEYGAYIADRGRLGGWNKSLEQWPLKLFSLYTLYKTFLLNRERIIVPEKVADS